MEHCRVRMPAHLAGKQGASSSGKPEQLLNRFVRFVAFVERVGNALGTLAFTWATVVLLGGYPTVLSKGFGDFACATTIVFLEAARMLSRSNNRHDYQLFFHTKGAFRPLGWNGLIVMVWLSNFGNYFISFVFTEKQHQVPLAFRVLVFLVVAFAPPVICVFQSARKLVPEAVRKAASIYGPSLAILLMVPSITVFTGKSLTVKWIVFVLLFLPVLLLTIRRVLLAGTCLLPAVIRRRILDSSALLGTTENEKESRRPLVVLRLCMLGALVMLVFMPDDPFYFAIMLIYDLYALVILSFGNLQIPAAVARVALALLRLTHQHQDYDDDAGNKNNNLVAPAPSQIDFHDPAKTNLAPSLNILYGMVLGQGVLYLLACAVEIFSFIPRRLLARRGGLGGRWGKKCVDLYYAYALERSMEGDVLAPKRISLGSFAVESLNSDAHKEQLNGIRVLHGLLLREETRKRLLSGPATSTKVMARVIEMLDWSSPEKACVRLFAAKVTAELASSSLRLVALPGAVQVVSSLLLLDSSGSGAGGNYEEKGRGTNPLLDPDQVTNFEHHHPPSVIVIDMGDDDSKEKEMQRLSRDRDTAALVETPQEHSSTRTQHQEVETTTTTTTTTSIWQGICRFWSIPEETPSTTEQDLLPALGMSILDGLLLGCDQEDNCVEISRATGLIPKIVSFASYSYYGRRGRGVYTDAQRDVLMASSLKLLRSLTSVHGEIGVTLRTQVSKNPFLLRNLARVLGDGVCDRQELKRLAAGIVRNLAVDGDARRAIGRNRGILSGLMRTFLAQPADGSSSGAEEDRPLRKVAGQALAMLAMDNVGTCVAMVREEAEHEFVRKLAGMIHVDRYYYRCVAASLLRNVCRHARPELKEPDLRQLSYILREVLERIMDAEGAELEILVGLSSQICQVIPGDFVRELEDGRIKDRFVKRLVGALNANMEPGADCPGIRRVILEQVVCLMEYDSRYADCFNERRVMEEALSAVEETASDVDNYSLFLGDAGLVLETDEQPLLGLVARAKQLLDVHSQQPSSSSGIHLQ